MKNTFTLLFVLLFVTVSNAQIANQPSNLLACDDDNDGIAIFDLTITEPEILGTQDPSEFSITFYTNQTDATNATNPIITPTAFYNSSSPESIYVRLEANSNGNFDTTSFALAAIAPPFAIQPTPLEVCDDDGDGFGEFDLTVKDTEIVGGDPDLNILYYETLVDAETGDPSGALASPYVNITPFSQIVFARAESEISGCYTIVELELVVLNGCPIIDTDPIDLFINEGDNDGSAIFDLTVNEPQMLGSQDPNLYLFSYYETFENSMDAVNAIVSPTAYQNIANPQTIYVRLTNSTNGSYVLTSFLIETDGVLGIDENRFEDLKLYPNPVTDKVTLQSQVFTSENTLTIFNLMGKKVFSETMTPQNGRLTVDVTSLRSGVYFIKITSEENSTEKRIIKK